MVCVGEKFLEVIERNQNYPFVAAPADGPGFHPKPSPRQRCHHT